MATTGSPFGLSEVHTPVGDEIVDVVFIHGLNGHPYDTWTSEKSKVFWPGQLLPLAVGEEKIRILVYGYHADITDGVSTDNIHNHAETLVAELFANRKGRRATERPIVFVAHSFGGLVVERALIYSSEIRGVMTEHLRSVFVSTYGILFFGTPHRGSDVTGWFSRLELICRALLPTSLIDTQPQLINTLKANSETLQNIERQFIQLASRFHIYFFHEGKPTNFKGTLRYIVSEESASPSIQDVERAVIQQDHSHMCKFEDDSAPGFHVVTEAIQRYADQALQLVISRWKTEKAEQEEIRKARAKELPSGSLVSMENEVSSKSSLPGPSKASKQLFHVPFPRDKSFIDRAEIFMRINKCMEQDRRVALSGMGGIGKSQIAIEYCYRYREVHPDAQVVWVHASTKQRIHQAYTEIAKRLELPEWNDPTVDTLRLVTDWFNNVENGNWLMVLDNADDLDMFFLGQNLSAHDGESTLPLVSYLPESSVGSMIITTRDQRLGKRLVERDASVEVNPMSPQEAQGLLAKRQTNTSDSLNADDSRQLLEALGYIPLAITQAAAFISENDISLTHYLTIFHTSDSETQDLLDQDLGDRRRDAQSHHSVIRTWKMSFDLISEQRPPAARILSLMAVLDRQGIPESLLRYEVDGEVEFTTALGTLKAFSLVSAGVGGAGYEIHRLVQLATRRWLEMQRKIEEWRQKALLVVADRFPIGKFEHWKICTSLLPHAQQAIQYGDANGKYPVEFSKLLSNAATFHFHQGRYDIALKWFESAFKVRDKSLGLDHPLTLKSMGHLAFAYQQQGRLEEAEHRDTLACMNNLALAYQKLGRLEEAEKIFIQVLETGQRVLGAEDRHVLRSMNNLAVAYQGLERLEEAEKIYIRVLETFQRMLGAEHLDTLTGMSNLASLYSRLGRLEEAEKLHTQVLKTCRRELGVEHPRTLDGTASLAVVYHYQGRYSEAITLLRNVVELRREVLGENHPDTKRAARWLKMWSDAESGSDL